MKRPVKSAHTMVSLVETYLAERRCLGFDLAISGQVLMNFARFADTAHDRGPITESMALAWAHSTPEIFKLDVASTIGFQAAFCSCV